MILKNIQTTFTASFGTSRTGRAVSVSVLDSDGNPVLSGFTAGSVVELSDGVYGCAVTFTAELAGYVKFDNTTDNLEIYNAVTVINDFAADISAIKRIEINRWKIESNQLTIYADNGTTPLYVFNLKKAGVANGSEPDERVPV